MITINRNNNLSIFFPIQNCRGQVFPLQAAGGYAGVEGAKNIFHSNTKYFFMLTKYYQANEYPAYPRLRELRPLYPGDTFTTLNESWCEDKAEVAHNFTPTL